MYVVLVKYVSHKLHTCKIQLFSYMCMVYKYTNMNMHYKIQLYMDIHGIVMKMEFLNNSSYEGQIFFMFYEGVVSFIMWNRKISCILISTLFSSSSFVFPTMATFVLLNYQVSNTSQHDVTYFLPVFFWNRIGPVFLERVVTIALNHTLSNLFHMMGWN